MTGADELANLTRATPEIDNGDPRHPDSSSQPLERSSRPGGAGGPVQGSAEGSQGPIPDYLPISICNLLFCCLPLGFAAVVYSIRTRDMNFLKKMDWARRHSRKAKVLNVAGMLMGLACYTVLTIIILLQYTHS